MEQFSWSSCNFLECLFSHCQRTGCGTAIALGNVHHVTNCIDKALLCCHHERGNEVIGYNQVEPYCQGTSEDQIHTMHHYMSVT